MYIDLNRIEFVITNACSGKCKHCSAGDHLSTFGSLDADSAVNIIKRLTGRFGIRSVMTFGGEPLLYAETVCKIHEAAKHSGIENRQLITNGYFSRDETRTDRIAEALCMAGVNDVLLSVDVFHQEFIPIEPVMHFAESLVKYGIPSLRVQPAWLVSEAHDNPYNAETRCLLKLFSDMGIGGNKGNVIFPAGNALKYLGEWFTPKEEIDLSVPCGLAPYTSRIDKINCFSIDPNGDVELCSIIIGNVYQQDILEITDSYDPYKKPELRALLKGGVTELLNYAESLGITIETGDCRSACGVCKKIMSALKEKIKAV